MFEEIVDLDDPFDWDDYVYHLVTPWRSLPHYLLATGQSPLPHHTRSSIAASATWSMALWSLGLSTRAVVAHYMAGRYMMPVQTPFALALAGRHLVDEYTDFYEPETQQARDRSVFELIYRLPGQVSSVLN